MKLNDLLEANTDALDVKHRWDKMHPDERAAVLRASDPTMKDPRYKGLIDRMSKTKFDDLTPIQQDAVVYAL